MHHDDLQPGGFWQPRDCISRHRVAIVIPFRDRWSHLRVLLHFLIPVLQRQQINFRIFVIEQVRRSLHMTFRVAWLFKQHCSIAYNILKWTALSEFGTYRLCEQRRFRLSVEQLCLLADQLSLYYFRAATERSTRVGWWMPPSKRLGR